MTNQMKYIFLGVLVAVLVGYLGYEFLLAPGPADNYQLPDMTQTSPAAAGAPAAGAPAPRTAAPAATLQRDEINVDDLILSVQEVSFDYDSVRQARDPMTPLVGRRFYTEAEGPERVSGSRLMQMARTMLLTGIIWDAAEPLAILNNEVVARGYVFSPDDDDHGIVVDTIEPGRVILRVEETLIPLNLEER